MAIDPRIALGYQPPQFEQPMNLMANAMKLQAMQQENALAQRQAAQLERQQMQQNRLGLLMARGASPEMLQREGFFEPAAQVLELETARAGQRSAAAAAAAAAQEKEMARRKAMFGVLAVAKDPAKYAAARDIAQGMGFDLTGIPEEFPGADYITALEDSVLTPAERAEREAKAATVSATIRGQDITAQTARRGQDITARGQDIAAETARLGQAIAVRGQDLNAMLQSPEHQNLISQARERAKADVKFINEFSAAEQTAQRTLNLLDRMLGDAKIVDGKIVVGKGERKPMKGVGSAVGASAIPGLRFVPGTSARDFSAAHDQAVGAAFMQAFATLKGGGQITEKEGEKATASLTRMNLAQSEKEYIAAAREFQAEVKAVLTLAQKRYAKLNSSYTASPTASVETPSIEDLLKKYEQ